MDDGWTVDTEEQQILDLANEVIATKKAISSLKETLETKTAQLLSFFPEQVGEVARRCDGRDVKITRGETFKWDSDILEQMFATRAVPPHVKQRFSVEKRHWEKLPEADQQALLPALTRALGAPKIEII